ncbi:MAG: MlaD family protein, partial [Actinomycetes bacterium]
MRRLAVAGLLIVALIVVAVVLLGGGDGYTVKARFQNASQLVKGNLVQVSGTAVGKVMDIRLADNGEAEVTFTVNDDYAPLRRGTLAIVRQASLSGIANRYIDLQQGPADGAPVEDGGLVPGQDTEAAVDIDQLFNIFDPKTRKTTRKVLEGFADLNDGRIEEARAALRYLNPALSA